MKLMIVSSYAPEIITFRGDLIKDFQSEGYEVFAVSPYDQEAFSILENEYRVNMVEWGLERVGTNPFKELKSFIELKQHINHIKPDVVFSYTVKPVVYSGLVIPKNIRAVALMSGLGSITRSHEINLSIRLTRRILHALYYFSFKKYDKVIYQNVDDQNLMVEEGIVPLEKTYVVDGSGVDTSLFEYVEPSKEISFLYVGRLLRDKGIYELIEASKRIKKEFPSVEIAIVGGLDDNPTSLGESELIKIVEDGIITYHGQVKNVQKYLHEYTILVHPSYHEGTSRAVLEALSTGRVIITTDAPGCYQTVSNNNGWLVKTGDVNSLYDAMVEALNTPYEKILAMSKNSRELAETVYDVEIINKNMLAIVGDDYEKIKN